MENGKSVFSFLRTVNCDRQKQIFQIEDLIALEYFDAALVRAQSFIEKVFKEHFPDEKHISLGNFLFDPELFGVLSHKYEGLDYEFLKKFNKITNESKHIKDVQEVEIISYFTNVLRNILTICLIDYKTILPDGINSKIDDNYVSGLITTKKTSRNFQETFQKIYEENEDTIKPLTLAKIQAKAVIQKPTTTTKNLILLGKDEKKGSTNELVNKSIFKLRELGTSFVIDSDLNNKLSLAKNLLQKELYDVALKHYSEITKGGENNGLAVLGIFMCQNKISNIDLLDSLNKIDSFSIKDFESILHDNPKSIASTYLLSIFRNFHKITNLSPLLLFHTATDYDVSGFGLDKWFEKNLDVCLSSVYDRELLTSSLDKYLSLVENIKYYLSLNHIIRMLIKKSNFGLAQTFNSRILENDSSDQNGLQNFLLISYRETSIETLIENMTPQISTDALFHYFMVADKSSSEELINLIIDKSKSFFESKKLAQANHLFKCVFRFDFKDREKAINTFIHLLSSNINAPNSYRYSDLEDALQIVSEEILDFSSFEKLILSISHIYAHFNNLKYARDVLKHLLVIDDANSEVEVTLFFYSLAPLFSGEHCISIDLNLFEKGRFYKLLESIDTKRRKKLIHFYCELLISQINSSNIEKTIKIYEFLASFEMDANEQFFKTIILFADTLLRKKFFKQANLFFRRALVTNIDSDKTLIKIMLCEYGICDTEDLFFLNVDLSTNAMFNLAIEVAYYNNEIDRYVSYTDILLSHRKKVEENLANFKSIMEKKRLSLSDFDDTIASLEKYKRHPKYLASLKMVVDDRGRILVEKELDKYLSKSNITEDPSEIVSMILTLISVISVFLLVSLRSGGFDFFLFINGVLFAILSGLITWLIFSRLEKIIAKCHYAILVRKQFKKLETIQKKADVDFVNEKMNSMK